jgi:hypothetical protein
MRGERLWRAGPAFPAPSSVASDSSCSKKTNHRKPAVQRRRVRRAGAGASREAVLPCWFNRRKLSKRRRAGTEREGRTIFGKRTNRASTRAHESSVLLCLPPPEPSESQNACVSCPDLVAALPLWDLCGEKEKGGAASGMCHRWWELAMVTFLFLICVHLRPSAVKLPLRFNVSAGLRPPAPSRAWTAG